MAHGPELRGSKNPESIKRLGLALGGISRLLMRLNRPWASGSHVYTVDELEELRDYIKFY